MPAKENYEPQHWFQAPEPTCTPGYTGYLPGYGPLRLFQFGQTFGKTTHELTTKHPVAGLRLGNLKDFSGEVKRQLEVESLAWQFEKNAQNNRYRRNMLPGYAGYVPRRKFVQGMSCGDECSEAMSMFEKLKLCSNSKETPFECLRK